MEWLCDDIENIRYKYSISDESIEIKTKIRTLEKKTLEYKNETQYIFEIKSLPGKINIKKTDIDKLVLQPGNLIKIPNEIVEKLNWKTGDKLWIEIVDEKIPTIEVGKMLHKAEEIKRAMHVLVEDE